MVIDTRDRTIYVLGRYMDTKPSRRIHNDFFMYDIASNRWVRIHENAADEGGPSLVFDHQMVIDEESKIIYVFGGRVLKWQEHRGEGAASLPTESVVFSGFYAYRIRSSSWLCLARDCGEVESRSRSLKPRVGHCMIFHPKLRQLLIFGGHQNKEYMHDFVVYDPVRDEVTERDASSSDLPIGWTMRASLDAELDEIYVYFGMGKANESSSPEDMKNSMWIYHVAEQRWTCFYTSDSHGGSSNGMAAPQPCARYAHQITYDSMSKCHFLFGGNPGQSSNPQRRLDDYWRLTLNRQTRAQLLRRCRYLVRRHRFLEMSASGDVKDMESATLFLQTKLSEVVDHSDPEETEQLHRLAARLFQPLTRNEAIDDSPPSGDSASTSGSGRFSPSSRTRWLLEQRHELFEQLALFFPDGMAQPRQNLLDLVQMVPNI